MTINLKNTNFLTLLDFSSAQIYYLLKLAAKLKAQKVAGINHKVLTGKNIALLFQKDSTRTRCAFEVAAFDLGMHTVYLGPEGSQMKKKESIADTAKVLGRMFDGIQFRGFKQDDIAALAKYSNVPVWNGLTDQFHPTQMLADMMTIQEVKKKPKLEQLKFVYFGDARFNMANSYMIVCAKLGINFIACAPNNLWPDANLVQKAKAIAKTTNATITLTTDYEKAAIAADIIATDVWVSMGEESSIWKQRISELMPYQVNMAKIKQAKADVIFLHCLPSFHNDQTTISQTLSAQFGGNGALEVTDEVFNCKNSHVFLEAENRLHTIKAVMLASLVDPTVINSQIMAKVTFLPAKS